MWYPYGYYPRPLYPYGYGAFGLGYFYYDPYAWNALPLYAYDYGFYGRSYDSPADTGKLQLKVAPRDAQVYIDGYFAGTVDDYDGRFQSLKLEGGTYHVQIVLPGFRTLEFDVRITPGQKITYTGELQPQP